jgi:hypothetical protein
MLLAEALSRRSGYPNSDGSWMTQAEAIFAGLVGQAAGSDLRAKRLLFDVLIKLQRADICWPSERLPQIQLDDGEDATTTAGAEIGRPTEDVPHPKVAESSTTSSINEASSAISAQSPAAAADKQ